MGVGMGVRARRLNSTLLVVAISACSEATRPVPQDCLSGPYTAPQLVPQCLEVQSRIGALDRHSADSLIASAQALLDSFRADTAPTSFDKAAELTAALQHLSDFYGKRLFDDTARFHRVLDHVAVTMEYERGLIRNVRGLLFTERTPWLVWEHYNGLGIYFQPVNTVQLLEWLMPSSATPDDSILNVAEQLYRYAVWREADGRRFPVWEYEFPWTSGGISVDAPWISGMAQGLALALFADAYRRTGSPLWRTRLYDLLNSLYVPWQDGGVLLPDTTHGYWWEEYHPVVQVWNGSAWALLGVGFAAQVTGDPEIDRLFQRGIDALKYYTPSYDTGSWTLYSRTQGYNTVAYHNLCVHILDAFYARTGDPWFSTVANRWRAYVPPPGVH
jgi:hypothetical protein